MGPATIIGQRWMHLRKLLDPVFSRKQALQLIDGDNQPADIYMQNLDHFALPDRALPRAG